MVSVNDVSYMCINIIIIYALVVDFDIFVFLNFLDYCDCLERAGVRFYLLCKQI